VAHGRLSLAAKTLAAAQRPLLLVGSLALDAPDGRRLWEIARRLGARWTVEPSVMRGRGNVFGAALAGLLPGRGPGGRGLDEVRQSLAATWGTSPAGGAGLSAPQILEAASRGELDLLYVVGGDPATDVPDGSRWEAARSRVPFVVVHDAFLSPTAAAADVVLPALVLPEKDGTVCNIEGRVQRLRRIAGGPGEARGDAAIFSALAARMGQSLAYSGWAEVFDEMRTMIPGYDVDVILPPAGPAEDPTGGDPGTSVPQADPEGAGAVSPIHEDDRLVLIPGVALFDQGAMSSRSGAIANLAGTPWALLHPQDAARLAVADGDAIVLAGAHGSVALRALVRPALLPGQVYVPRGYDAAPLNLLVEGAHHHTVVQVRVLAAAGASGEAEERL
jgi:predicted molibdopterin-dependent oxidoreductase YjgC